MNENSIKEVTVYEVRGRRFDRKDFAEEYAAEIERLGDAVRLGDLHNGDKFRFAGIFTVTNEADDPSDDYAFVQVDDECQSETNALARDRVYKVIDPS